MTPIETTTTTLLAAIAREFDRLQLHSVNLSAVPGDDGQALLRGSLVAHWKVPANIDAAWLLDLLKQLPDRSGPRITMDAYFAAFSAEQNKQANRETSQDFTPEPVVAGQSPA